MKKKAINILKEAEERDKLDEIRFRSFVSDVLSVLWPLKELESKHGLSLSGNEILQISNSILGLINVKTDDDFCPIIEAILDSKNLSLYDFARELVNPQSTGNAEINSIYEALRQTKFLMSKFRMLVKPAVDRFVSSKLESVDVSTVPSENDDGEPEWGKFLFAPQRKGEVPNEPNEREEEIAYLEIEDYIHNNQAMSPKTVANFKKAIRDGSYKKILHEPDVEYVYRGIKITREGLEKLLMGEIPSEKGSAIINRTIWGRGDVEGASSWSISTRIAADFAGFHKKPGTTDYYSAVFVAKVKENPNNFMSCPDGVYRLPTFETFVGENEVIALGPIKVYKIHWDSSGNIPFGPINESFGKSFDRNLRILIREVLQTEFSSRRTVR